MGFFFSAKRSGTTLPFDMRGAPPMALKRLSQKGLLKKAWRERVPLRCRESESPGTQRFSLANFLAGRGRCPRV